MRDAEFRRLGRIVELHFRLLPWLWGIGLCVVIFGLFLHQEYLFFAIGILGFNALGHIINVAPIKGFLRGESAFVPICATYIGLDKSYELCAFCIAAWMFVQYGLFGFLTVKFIFS